jgi:lipopolysaccharide/colanic/teichoic acid biosynthesis glycosyltransferase
LRQGENVISECNGTPPSGTAGAVGVRRLRGRERRPARPIVFTLKRVADVALSMALLVVFAPVMLLLACAILLDSRGGVFYSCERTGHQGRTFGMLKFRKMHRDAAGSALTLAEDRRFTRMGRFLSDTKLDELPQLWNVVRGDMSLVGPRPEDPSFVAAYPELFAEILTVRPGVTGLAQLAFVREARLLGVAHTEQRYVEWLLPSKLAIDRLYVARRSLLMDLQILVWTTVAVVLKRDVSVHRESGALTIRRRPEPEAGT